MTARQLARTQALAAVVVLASASLASAQPRMARGPNPDAPKLMVSACQISDKILATMCADKVRSQIEGDISLRALTVIPKGDVENTLSASGYDPAVHLTALDAVTLAKSVHADFYVDATMEKAGANYKVNASVVLSRDANMRQPIGTYEHARFETVAEQVSRGFQDVFNKTFDHQKDCFTAERERKYEEALKQAADGLKDYPNSTWLRHCKLAVLKDQKTPGNQVAALLEEIIKLDPTNKAALQDLVVIYDAQGDKEKKIATLEQLRQADPTDARRTAEIVNELAAMGQFDKARAIVEPAIAQNGGDINLIRPYWLIVMNSATRYRARVDSTRDDARKKAYSDSASREYKKAIDVGKQMATMDTSTADTTYFQRMISAAGADSNFAEAADMAHRARLKFPKVSQFYLLEYGAYQRVGDNARALAAAKAAIAADPNVKNLRARVAAAYLAENPPNADSAIAIVKEMIAKGEDKEQVAQVAVQTGNVVRVQIDSVKAHGADAVTLQAAAEHAFQVTAWADTLATGTGVAAQGKFVMGVAAMGAGSGYLTKASETVNKVVNDIRAMKPMPDAARQKAMLDPAYAEGCALVTRANNYFTIAQQAVPAGGRFDPKTAQLVMGQLMQMNGYVDQATKQFCHRP